MRRVDFSKIRFLIADDHEYSRRLMREILVPLGAEAVFEAEDGPGALDALKQFGPDIVFVDWLMPVLDGVEFTRVVRSDPDDAVRFIPIVMMTGHPEFRRVIQARDAGVTEFIRKPFSAKMVLERVVSVVVNPRPFVRAAGYFGPDRRRIEATPAGFVERRRERRPPDGAA
jgi:CheY-like chemotaxis protein